MSATVSASSKAQLAQKIWRYILLIHRYLGIGIGLIVLLWCTSGIIMMYVQYPELDRHEGLALLEPLDVTQSLSTSPARSTDAALAVSGFRVEAGSRGSLMRLTLTNGETLSFDLANGELIEQWSADALDVLGAEITPGEFEASWVDRDQWTVHGRFNPHRPLRKITTASGDEWYLSSRTGAVVQATTRWERFWNWPGAVIHWIYPTVLRQNTAAWAQVVIWLTIVSLFLTISGIAIGIRQFRWRGDRRRSPYAGWSLWHHYSGLIFGLMTLVWLGSGLLSMNPWGALEGRGVAAERQALNGLSQSLAEAVAAVATLLPHLPADTVRLETAPWLGELFFLAWRRDAMAIRLTTAGPATPLSHAHVVSAARRLDLEGANIELLEAGDAYYFAHHSDIELPVYRIRTVADERFYLSATSGELVAHYDENRRWYRWLFEGLHRGDFHPLMRARPFWDVFMLLFLIGVTAGAATGVYMAWRRVRPD